MALEFEWDPAKTVANWREHRVRDPRSITIPDPDHSGGEDRFVLIGRSQLSRVLVVVHLERGARLRLISARLATRRERQRYEEEDQP